MIRSILKQLSIQCPETPEVLSMLFSSCQDTDRPPTINELLEVLYQVLRNFYNVYIVLDALDECSNREDLLEYLYRLLSWNTEHLHILVSSRPERAVEEGITRLVKGDNRIRVQGDQVNDDIRIYIRARLDQDPKLKRWQKRLDVRNEIESCLMKKADGMFRLVVCQIDELTTCFTRPQLQERLKSLPKTLDDMYATSHARIVQCLLDSAADVNCAAGKYANALQAASREGHLPVVQTLLRAGANVAQRGSFYGDALQAAAFYGHDTIVQALLLAGADVNQQSGGIYGNALQAASRNGHDKVVRDLIAAGARVNNVSGMYHTALQSAARGAQGSVIKRLLEAGAEVNAQGGKYGNALQAACLRNELKVVRQLLEAGADINAHGGMYGTALQTACAHGYEQIVQILLDAHANVNMRGGFLGSAVVAAAKNGHDAILELLLKAGADVKGWTIAITVTRTSHRQVIALLEEAGVGINRDGNGDGGGSDALLAQDFVGINIANSGDDDGHIRQAALSVKFCDECGRSIPNGEKYWHCAICKDDDWDSCQDCVRAGFSCPARKHKMVRRQIQGGIFVDVDDDDDNNDDDDNDDDNDEDNN
ncbi:hypothetical protein JMJ35_002159 [Cladonia borealis]|uniref:Nephrocystin 3-like N-terminal domain-containing protein n=1 Tax=Cladonia borealis TaxID=184061 RepID=A0AA39R994_9LECA|nr:hypothetical protein JMJ35_002159 [Cladonia borealis]